MATLPTLDRFGGAPEVRLLPSTGVTRFHRYYGPVRHPTRPGLSLAGVRLTQRVTAGVSRVASFSLCVHAVASTPAGFGSLGRSGPPDQGRIPLPSEWQPSPCASRVGSHIAVFEASMAFTFVTAYTLAEPHIGPFHRRLQPFRYLNGCSDCYRQERKLPGGTNPH